MGPHPCPDQYQGTSTRGGGREGKSRKPGIGVPVPLTFMTPLHIISKSWVPFSVVLALGFSKFKLPSTPTVVYFFCFYRYLASKLPSTQKTVFYAWPVFKSVHVEGVRLFRTGP